MRERKQPSRLESAFLEAASLLDRQCPGMEVDHLQKWVVLSFLRRQLFASVFRWGYAESRLADPQDTDALSSWWDFGREMGCPLLRSDLEPRAKLTVDPLQAVSLCTSPLEVRDIGELHQSLGELTLSRKKKGHLALDRGRTARRRTGMFFTPDWMASRLSAMALDPLLGGITLQRLSARVRILDPACGSGRLLLACLDRMLAMAGPSGRQRSHLARELIPAVLRGVDIDPLSVALTRSLLWMVADPRQGEIDGLDDVIVQGDTLCGPLEAGLFGTESFDWAGTFPLELGVSGRGFSVVIANPPFEVLKGYARRQGLRSYVERIRKSGYDLALSGNLNTYRLFLERSLQLLEPGGRLAFVVPYGFLMDRTAAPLRSHMLRSGWIQRVEVYPESARAFSGVGQSVILLLAAKDKRPCERLTVKNEKIRVEECKIPVAQLAKLDAHNMPIPVASAEALGLVAKVHALNTASLAELAIGKVGEVDQTNFRSFMLSEPGTATLLRGTHLAPYRPDLSTDEPAERWLDLEGFDQARAGGRWRMDVKSPRVVQTGIVNMEASRRLVAAEVPEGVYLGNSVNYWVPRELDGWDPGILRGYLLGLLNSTPMEWRFRLTSSNNNINLYEIRVLPVPALVGSFPKERVREFLDGTLEQIRTSRASVQGTVREVTTGWGSPSRNDHSAAMLIAHLARLREVEADQLRSGWLDAVLDHFICWHLGMDESDLERMLQDVPSRRFKEG